MSSNLGRLWVIATPLGNPGDLSPRAREILARSDAVLAEDTRRAGLLLARCAVAARAFISFHDHNEEKRLPQILEALADGKELALISDAGTPLLSDPGYRLVRACRKHGLAVSPVPGPSAPAAALCASGLPPQPFVFLGFPPRKQADQKAFFAPYAALHATLVFFERKDRLAATLGIAYALLGLREVCIARELTKTHEEFILFPLGTPVPEELRGELTVLVGPPLDDARDEESTVRSVIAEESARGGKPRDVARRVLDRVTGWTGKEVYRIMRTERSPAKQPL